MSRLWYALLLTVAALTGLTVSALNVTRIDVELAFLRVRTPIGVALVAAFTLGLLAGLLWRVRWVAQLLGERGRLRRELRLAELRGREAVATERLPVSAKPNTSQRGSDVIPSS
jgi:uncharacterized integral membrane protein